MNLKLCIDMLTRLVTNRVGGAVTRSSDRAPERNASGRRLWRLIHRLRHPSKELKNTFWILTTLALSLTFWFTLIMYWINTND